MKIIRIIEELYLSFIRNLDGSLGFHLRYCYYKKRMKYLGENVRIDTGVFISDLQYVSIFENTHIDKYCILVACSPELDLSFRALKFQYNQKNEVKKGELIIGKNCHIAQFCMIFAHGGVKIGDKCVMSAFSKIYSLSSLPFNPQNNNLKTSIVPYDEASPSIIGNIEFETNVWIGINVCVFPGVRIERDSFVRTNSIIQKSFSENSYIAGDPAKFIKPRYGA